MITTRWYANSNGYGIEADDALLRQPSIRDVLFPTAKPSH